MASPRPRWQRRILERAIRHRMPGIVRRLRTRRNVRSIGFGFKFRDGRMSRETAVIAYVRAKGRVPPGHLIPRRITLRTWLGPLSIATDVIEIPRNPRLCGLASGDPVLAEPMAGTCAVAWSDERGSYLLTNDHVVRDLRTGQDRAMIVADVDGTHFRGAVVRTTRVSMSAENRHDAAVIAFASQMRTTQWGVGDARLVDIGMVGRGQTYGYLAPDHQTLRCVAIARVDDSDLFDLEGAPGPVRYRGYWIMSMSAGVTRAGHSGALVCRPVGPNAVLGVGLVFARLEQRNWVYVLDANAEWRALGLAGI